MSFGDRPGSSRPHQGTDERHPGTPASMTPKERKRRQFENAINSAILAATVTRSAGDSTPLLGPLKGLMGSLISALENVKGAKKFEEDWEDLSSTLESRIKILLEYIEKPASVQLQELVSNYKQTLERVIREVDPLAKRHKIWSAVSSSNDGAQIRDITRRMDDALKDFTTQLQMRMEEGISHIHSEQQAVQEELTAHRTDHARTHARVLEIQEEQHRVDHMIKEIHAEQKEISLKLTEAEQITLLKGLTTARLANGDNHDTCMKGTRSFILDEARSWMEDGNSPQIFWLADVAGSGKSTVANHLAREWKSGKRLGGRFFFSRDAEQTRTPIYFFTTIAQQGLSHLGPTVRATIVESIRELYDPVSAPLEDQCISLFVRPLEKISSPVVIVLDALDECEPITVTRLFHILIPQLANLHHLKLFLTSRPENYIMEILKNQTIHRVALTGNHGGNRADVKHFMGQKLRSIELPETQVDSLVKRSEGLFIWASTVCKLLQTFRGDRDKFIADLLVQGPRQMNAVYQVALQQALWSGYGEEANLEAYKKVLGVIVTAFEPLSPKSIDELLEIENSFDIVKDLQSVLDCPDYDAPVRFLHPTFREFLLDPLNGHPCQIGEESFHLNLAKMCLDFMARNLQWNLCNLPTKLSTDGLSNSRGNEDEIYWISGYDRTAWLSARNHSTDWGEYQQLRLDEYVSWVLQYSCRFWVNHLDCCKLTELLTKEDVSFRLKRFSHENLLDWIYVLSFMKSTKDPWKLMRTFLKAQTNKEPMSWAKDTAQFLKTYWHRLRENPLNVYHSFAFTPKSTIFQTVYSQSQSFPHPTMVMSLEEDWPTNVPIDTHDIRTSCLSECGNLFATGGIDGKYATYGLWSVLSADGETNIHPCNTQNCYVHRVSFYKHQSSLRLQTFCKCNFLCTWDPLTQPNHMLNAVRLDPDKIYHEWSKDGSKTVVRKVNELYLWKQDKPNDYYLLRQGSLQWRWIFSPKEGDRLAARKWNNLEVWDCVTLKRLFRKQISQLASRSNFVEFSPDARTIIVSLRSSIECLSSEDGTTIWSVAQFATSPTFFFSGQKIALNQRDQILIISATDGSVIVDLHGPFLRFCTDPHDEQRVVCLGEDGIISSWNLLCTNDVHRLGEVYYMQKSIGYFGVSWLHQTLVYTQGSTIHFHSVNLIHPG